MKIKRRYKLSKKDYFGYEKNFELYKMSHKGSKK